MLVSHKPKHQQTALYRVRVYHDVAGPCDHARGEGQRGNCGARHLPVSVPPLVKGKETKRSERVVIAPLEPLEECSNQINLFGLTYAMEAVEKSRMARW